LALSVVARAIFREATMNRDLGVWASEESALVLIDYQAELLESIRSETGADLVELHALWLAKAAKAFGIAASALKLAGGPNPQAPAPGWR
jgi:nicotinamidase-related amidase